MKRRISPQALQIAVLALQRDMPDLDERRLYDALTVPPAPAAVAAPVQALAAPGALLRPTEAAARLGCSRRTVFTLIRSGRLPAIKLGMRSTRVPLAAILALQAAAPLGG
jgi:excisionase family DNA binding protein